MGKKLFKHINELRAKAMAGNVTAQQALEAALFVPHHLRQRRGGPRVRTGYSGTKSNAYVSVGFKGGLTVTAKTHQAVRTRDAMTVSPEYGLDRLQMLKDRRDRREARA